MKLDNKDKAMLAVKASMAMREELANFLEPYKTAMSGHDGARVALAAAYDVLMTCAAVVHLLEPHLDPGRIVENLPRDIAERLVEVKENIERSRKGRAVQ